jgi:hypothetical protein
MMTDQIQTIAGEVAAIDEEVLKFFPYISGMIGFIPGAAVAEPFMPLVGEILQAVDNAAKAVQAGNTSAAINDILTEIRNHLTPGLPNSSVLSSPAVNPNTP